MAINKEIKNEFGQITNYHRISELTYDFDNGQLHILLDSYASSEYRDIEKEFIKEIENKINDYYELKKIIEQQDKDLLYYTNNNKLTDEERIKYSELMEKLDNNNKLLNNINIQELKASKYEKMVLKTNKITVDINDDMRNKIYELIKNLPEFKESIDI